MTLLPIVQRELRVAARQRLTHWTRVAAAGGATLLALWFLRSGLTWKSAGGRGHELFIGLGALALGFCLFGFLLTAECLSEERREGTLGLLFLTDVTGYDVVLGKLAAHIARALQALLSLLPVMALVILLGGVTLGELARVMLVLLNTLLFSSLLGLACSACWQEERRGFWVASLLLLVLACASPVFAWHLSDVTDAPWLEALRAVSPITVFMRGFAGAYKSDAAAFWRAFLVNHLLCWLFLVIAGLAVAWLWLERPPAAWLAPWRARWRHWNFGQPERAFAARREALDENPVAWLAARNQLRPVYTWLVLLLTLAVLLLGRRALGVDSLAVATLPALVLAQLIFKVWVAAEATLRATRDRHSGALDLLLVAPVTERALAEGYVRALRRQFANSVLALSAGAFALIAWTGDDSLDLPVIGLLLVFWMDLHTLAWVGVWQGLTCRRVNRALAATLWRVLLTPWIVLVAVLSLARPNELSGESLALLWLAICAVCNAWFVLNTRRRLHQQLRRRLSEAASAARPANGPLN